MFALGISPRDVYKCPRREPGGGALSSVVKVRRITDECVMKNQAPPAAPEPADALKPNIFMTYSRFCMEPPPPPRPRCEKKGGIIEEMNVRGMNTWPWGSA